MTVRRYPLIAFFLAAGTGSRLGSVTARYPKPMLRLGGLPIVEHNIALMRRCGIRRVVVNTHHCGDVIEEHLGDGSRWDLDITYSPEAVLLGTAGALKRKSEVLNERFLVVYADNLFRGSPDAILATHARSPGAMVTIGVHHRSDVRTSGEVVRDTGGRVVAFHEKRPGPEPRPGWVNAGLVVMEPSVLDHIPDARPSDIGSDLIPTLLSTHAGSVMAAPFRGIVTWVDTPDDLRRARAELGGVN